MLGPAQRGYGWGHEVNVSAAITPCKMGYLQPAMEIGQLELADVVSEC